ncbi:hypothetical protein AC481_06190 [miscellaneous Crenarchaeota group archaeon SMTZ-80]|nr:MAG: hypothetical protein AC481_06190 [miscellaneous Crenarchaeota group archaeon SMTZ-80]
MNLFKDKGALSLDRLSVEIIGRTEEAKRLDKILEGTSQGYLPKVISVFGPPGSGKTLVTRKLCKDYEIRSEGKFKSLYVNIGGNRTVFSVANKLFMALGGEPQLSRIGINGILEKFWNKIIDLGGSGTNFILVILDEVDRLFLDRRGDPSGFMYELVRSEDRLENAGIKLSLLTISNDIVWDFWELDGRVRSSMGTEETFFTPYSGEDLRQILEGRCKEAFEPGVIDEKVLHYNFLKYFLV